MQDIADWEHDTSDDVWPPHEAIPIEVQPQFTGLPLPTWRIEYKQPAPDMPITTEAVRIYCNGKEMKALVMRWCVEFEAQQPVYIRVCLEASRRIELRPTSGILALPHAILIDGEAIGGVLEYRCYKRDHSRAIELTLIPSAVEIVQVP